MATIEDWQRKIDVYHISLRQAAKQLAISRASLRHFVEAGRIPFRRTPTGRMFFAPADLDALRAETGATPP